MNRIGWKVASRSGLYKHISIVRKKVACCKEGKKLFDDNGLHSLRGEEVLSKKQLFEGTDLQPFCEDEKNVGKLP